MSHVSFRRLLWEIIHPDKKWVKGVAVDDVAMLEAEVRGLVAGKARAEEGQQLWREMFCQLREEAANVAPVITCSQKTQVIRDLCSDDQLFELELDRRIYRPEEAQQIVQAVKDPKDEPGA